MPVQSFGKVTVTLGGTPVRVTSTVTNCTQLYIQALAANTGKIYVGLSNLVKATLVGALAVLPIPSAALIPTYIPWSLAQGGIDLSTIWLDADVNGEGVLISYLVI